MKYSSLILVLLLCGCAKRQLEHSAIQVGTETIDHDIRFTYELKNDFCTEYFGMVGFVLENRTNHWITVDSIIVSSDSVQQANIAITGGEDIETWFASMSKVRQIESMNKQLLWGSISAAAVLGETISKDERVKRAAKIAAVTGGVMMTLERFNFIRNQLEMQEYFPVDHLMRTPFRIPPGLGVDKWVVINTQVLDESIICSNMKLKIYYSNNTVIEYFLQFLNAQKNMGRWQHNVITNGYRRKKSQ